MDAGTGLATSWNPNANNAVTFLNANGSTIYASGLFTTVGGQARNRLAALNAATGLATAWNPNPNSSVNTVVVNGSTVYVGGIFTSIGGQTRNRLASLDATTGLATTWDPSPNSIISKLAIFGNKLFAGGSFILLGAESQNALAVFSINVTLPVQLLSFTAKLIDPNSLSAGVVCNWSTASEENSSHFIIERSNDGRNFISAGQVMASGNSSSLQTYSFADHTPVRGIVYYRLKQVDRDNKSAYSRIAAVSGDKSVSSFAVYPNPATSEAIISITSLKKENAVYNIFDQAGRKLLSKSVSLNEGVNIIPVSVAHLPVGVYMIQLSGTSIFKQTQLLRQ